MTNISVHPPGPVAISLLLIIIANDMPQWCVGTTIYRNFLSLSL